MKYKFIIECESKEEKNCIEDALMNYKDYIEEEMAKDILERSKVYYEKIFQTVAKMISEIK